MEKIFKFGENIDEYDVTVLNEREVRASAGILFLFALIAFLNSWLIGDFVLTKIFVVIFLVDFFIRLFVNPKYSPSLTLGRFIVRNQKVEYVGAPQKRFAWGIGFVLALSMFYLLVLKNMVGPVNLLVCLTCLTFLFFESAFGICIGCKIYNLFHKEKAKLCPGNTCSLNEREKIQNINFGQYVIVFSFLFLIYGVSTSSLIHSDDKTTTTENTNNISVSVKEECIVPEWVKKIGHEEKWKLHNKCN